MARVLFKVSFDHLDRVPRATREGSKKTDSVYLPREVMMASATFFGASL